MAPMDQTFLASNKMGNRDAERLVFHYLTSIAWAAVAKADLLLCNTFTDLEPDIFTLHRQDDPPHRPASHLEAFNNRGTGWTLLAR
jgi:hypothetical protein